MREWWPAIFVFTLLIVLTCFVYFTAYPPKKGGQMAQPAGQVPGKPLTAEQQQAVERFWQLVEQHKPQYVTDKLNCLVDGTKVELGNLLNKDSDNRYGGVTSDVMSIALAPPPGGMGQPDFLFQDWMKLPGTCPTCGATYMEIDLHNISIGLVPNGEKALKAWKLAEQAPPLAKVPKDKWTSDERLFVRYLTMRVAGFPRGELGFYSLPCAYASNFCGWYGDPLAYRVPAPAFYALAATELKAELDDPSSRASDLDKATAAMMMGECYRLLGRFVDAAKGYERARKFNTLDDVTLDVLKQLESWQTQGDSQLHRVEVQDARRPPVGWYIEEMLPAINANLDATRAQWAALDDRDQIVQQILATIDQAESQIAAATKAQPPAK